MKPTLEVTVDNTDEFNKIVASFKRDAVLIGIPQDEAKREESAPINNAALLAINEFGSAVNNIPPRPVMAIGLKKAADEIAEQFKLAVVNSFKQGLSALNTYYNRAGIIASNSVKKVINSQEGIEPPSEATLAARKAKGFAGTKALIVTGQMRNAITYVVKGGF
jgi:hypothetical protein